MTSTNLYSGYDQGRPTSKVMAPPGGASSNIFGTDATSYAAPRQEKVQQETSNNRLFGGDAPEQRMEYTAPKDEKSASAPAGVNTHAGKSRNHGAYNPITGEDYPDKASQAPAQRVRQPPGGKSSGPLW